MGWRRVGFREAAEFMSSRKACWSAVGVGHGGEDIFAPAVEFDDGSIVVCESRCTVYPAPTKSIDPAEPAFYVFDPSEQ